MSFFYLKMLNSLTIIDMTYENLEIYTYSSANTIILNIANDLILSNIFIYKIYMKNKSNKKEINSKCLLYNKNPSYIFNL